jgi:hypothetical protein
MTHHILPPNIPAFFDKNSLKPIISEKEQEFEDRKGEAKRIVKRLAAIVEEQRLSAIPLGIEFNGEDLRSVISALRDHAKGGTGIPMLNIRDEIHAHVLTRLFEELVEEPSNILFTTITGPETTRYDAMNPSFWIECLNLMEKTYCASTHPKIQNLLNDPKL